MKAFANTFSSLYLVFPDIKSKLQEWAIYSRHVKFSPRIGFFDPKTTVFSFDFRNDSEMVRRPGSSDRHKFAFSLTQDALKDFKGFSTSTTGASLENLSLRFSPEKDLREATMLMRSGISPMLDNCLCLSSVEIIIRAKDMFCWGSRYQNRRTPLVGQALHELEGYQEYWIWKNFVCSLKSTCSPGECCTCCIRPALKLRVIEVENEPGQERTVFLPDIRQADRQKCWFFPVERLTGGMSKAKRQKPEAATTSPML